MPGPKLNLKSLDFVRADPTYSDLDICISTNSNDIPGIDIYQFFQEKNSDEE
jgi:hypothetical protein